MSTLAATLASALELPPADRDVLMIALRAANAGLELDPTSVRSSTDAAVRAVCGRPAPWDTVRERLASTLGTVR